MILGFSSSPWLACSRPSCGEWGGQLSGDQECRRWVGLGGAGIPRVWRRSGDHCTLAPWHHGHQHCCQGGRGWSGGLTRTSLRNSCGSVAVFWSSGARTRGTAENKSSKEREQWGRPSVFTLSQSQLSRCLRRQLQTKHISNGKLDCLY